MGQFILSEHDEPAKFSIAANGDTSELFFQYNDVYLAREVSEFSATRTKEPLMIISKTEQGLEDVMIASPTNHADKDTIAVVHRGLTNIPCLISTVFLDNRNHPNLLRLSFQSGIENHRAKHQFQLVQVN